MTLPRINGKGSILVIALVLGCGPRSDRPKQKSDTGKISMKMHLPSGGVIDSVHWSLACTPPTTPNPLEGNWNVSNSTTISGVVGGMADGATCTIQLSATDSTVPAGSPANCQAAIANVTASANNTRPTTANLSLVCQRGSTTARGQVGSITGLATVEIAGNTHTCASIQDFVANPGEVYVGSSIALTGTVLPGGNSDGSAVTDPRTMTMTKAASDPNTLTQVAGGWNYLCNAAGTYTLTVSVADSFTANGQSCGVNSDTFQVVCMGTGGGGTGGETGLGGTATTGGSEAIGGTGPVGGTGPGGSPYPIFLIDDLMAVGIQGHACSTCAANACGDVMGALGCGYFTGSYDAVSAFAGSSVIGPIALGQSITQTAACGATLSCVLSSGTLGSGSCYAPLAESATACYCGTADVSTCMGGGGNGVCKSLYEISLNTTSAGTVASIFTDYNYPGGDANYILQCLNANCPSQCFHAPGVYPNTGGSNATGGRTSTGGTLATGGTLPTGGTGPLIVADDYTALAAQGDDCAQCALALCRDLIGPNGCGYFAGSRSAVSGYPGSGQIPPIAVGQTISETFACGATLSCILSSGQLDSNSCYEPIADSFVACYCGTADAAACMGGAANGSCKALYEIASGSLSPATVAETFIDYNHPGGNANAIASCLGAHCPSQCFHEPIDSQLGTGGNTSVSSTPVGGATSTGGTGSVSGGATSTGGTAPIIVTDDYTALAAQGEDCSQCALASCSDVLGILGCEYFLGSYTAVSPYPGNTNINPIAVAQPISQTLACGVTLSCILASGSLGADSNANCYAPIADSATACYCGTVDADTCLNGGGNGVCKALYENSLNATEASTIAVVFADDSYPGGKAGYIAQCLNAYCPSQCFHSND